MKLPSILLEGDQPPAPPAGGPGEKFSIGIAPVAAATSAHDVTLPETYGTGRVFLTPRDPHWLYANWDLTHEQQAQHNVKSEDGHLILRVHQDKVAAEAVAEVHVHPESRHWFVHVEQPEQRYVVELGYYRQRHRWIRVAVSPPAITPRSRVTAGGEVRFATLSVDAPLSRPVEAQAVVHSGYQPLLPPPQLADSTWLTAEPALPEREGLPMEDWTPTQEAAIVEALSFQREGNLPLAKAQHASADSSLAWAESFPPAGGSPFHPFGPEAPARREFWFRVGAELVLHGATAPGAAVTLGGLPVAVDADGTFSARFALPDGTYEIPAVAVSAEGTERRAVQLAFQRNSVATGEIGALPSDTEMPPPGQSA